MSDPQPAATGLSDDQLRIVAGYVTRICLEVERGLRPPEHLRGLADPRTAGLWPRSIQTGRFRGGPVVRQDIGPPNVSRVADDHAIATIVTRTERTRWGALTLRLRAEGRRWYVADLQRLLAAGHYRSGPNQTATPEAPVEQQLRAVVDERRIVDAALHATNRRLDELAPHHASRGDTSRQADQWRRRIDRLDAELRDLQQRHQAAKTSLPRGRRR
jgi:hypothetical protein